MVGHFLVFEDQFVTKTTVKVFDAIEAKAAGKLRYKKHIKGQGDCNGNARPTAENYSLSKN